MSKKGQRGEGENRRRTPHSPWELSLTWGSVPGPWDHDPSPHQESEAQLSAPPRCYKAVHFLIECSSLNSKSRMTKSAGWLKSELWEREAIWQRHSQEGESQHWEPGTGAWERIGKCHFPGAGISVPCSISNTGNSTWYAVGAQSVSAEWHPFTN